MKKSDEFLNKETIYPETIHPKTIWTFIKDDIELKIINSELKSGDKVPSISEIATTYDVSKTTSQKALEDMFDEGTITKRKGVGYFVVPYQKERLRAKHKQELVKKVDDCISYANKLDMSMVDIEEIKGIFLKRIDGSSSQ